MVPGSRRCAGSAFNVNGRQAASTSRPFLNRLATAASETGRCGNVEGLGRDMMRNLVTSERCRRTARRAPTAIRYGRSGLRLHSYHIMSLRRLSAPNFRKPCMYLPAHFEESNIDVLHDLIRQFSLGTMVTQGPNGLDAN